MTVAANEPTILKRHRTSLYLLAICIAVLGLMFLLTVSKDLRNRRTLETRLADAALRADNRQLLAPLLAQLRSENEASGSAEAIDNDISLPAGDMTADNYETIIGEIVRQCDLDQTFLAPDLQSILSDTDSLRVDLTARGAFQDFRRLLLTLARLPFLSAIEGFRIEVSADTGMPELFLQLRLQLAAPVEGGHEHQ